MLNCYRDSNVSFLVSYDFWLNFLFVNPQISGRLQSLGEVPKWL